MHMVDSLKKKYLSNYIKISKILAMLRSFLNKDPTVWIDGARPHLGMLIAYSDNTFGRLADFLSEIHSMYMVN